MSPALRAILFILLGVLCGSLNDLGIKLLSGEYPLHQMIFVRSIVGVLVSLVFLHLEGAWRCCAPKGRVCIWCGPPWSCSRT